MSICLSRHISFLICLFSIVLLLVQPTMADQKDSTILVVKGGTILPGTGEPIENGMILITEGLITAVGRDIKIPENCEVISAADGFIMPGLIDAFTHLGTADYDSYGSDHDETTSVVNPHFRITDAINPDNPFIFLARKSGVTAALSAPGESNLISGQSAIIHLLGGSVQSMIIRFPAGIHASLGELPKMRFGKKGICPMTRMGEAALLRATLTSADEYAAKWRRWQKRKRLALAKKQSVSPAPAKDLKMEALLPVLSRELPLIIRANRYDDIFTALRIAREYNVKIIINHGAEAYRMAEELAKRNIPVILCPDSQFQQRLETEKARYENAVILNQSGVKIAFQSGYPVQSGSILHQARETVRHGLPVDEAIKALTVYPAEILAVDEHIGSLQPGKYADMIIFDRPPLDPLARIVKIIIHGEVM